MSKELKMKAIELLSNHIATVEMKPTINGIVRDEFLAVTDCCHNAITTLIDNGYIVSIQEGKMIIDKLL